MQKKKRIINTERQEKAENEGEKIRKKEKEKEKPMN